MTLREDTQTKTGTALIELPKTTSVPAVPKSAKWNDNALVKELYECLRYRRPRGSQSEQDFLQTYLDARIGGLTQDESGNIYKIVGNDHPKMLWSCHTDSVHTMDGKQSIQIDGDWFRLADKSKSNCLGADDMAGIWLLLHMIEAEVPGMYVFHYGEESGCIGSRWVARENPQYLDGIKASVAFDRRGFGDVITHQMGRRCASDTFAKSLAKLLPLGYSPTHGVVTDTASYMSIIPECSNVSVGYFDEHSKAERLNIPHILSLRESLIKITQSDIDKLEIVRDPNFYEPEVRTRSYGRSWQRSQDRSEGIYTGKYGNRYQIIPGTATADSAITTPSRQHNIYDQSDLFDDNLAGVPDYKSKRGNSLRAMFPESIEEIVTEYPQIVSEILEEYGFDHHSLFDEVQDRMEGK